jgi:hypothetical protein
VLGVSQIDKLLEAARYPAEVTPHRPAWQFLAEDSPSRSEDDYVGDAGDPEYATSPTRMPVPKPKSATIEITSSKSSTGKTSLLCYMTAMAVLPRSLNGKELTVVYIDNDGRFSATYLARLMYHHILSLPASQKPSDKDVQHIIHEALNHVHVLHPQSSTQLLAAISSLTKFLLNSTSHASSHRSLGLVILDSATAFYWQDRHGRDMSRLESTNAISTDRSTTDAIIDALKALQESFGCSVLFSTNTPPPPRSSSSTNPDQTSEPTPITPAPSLEAKISPWTAYATLTLSVSRVPVSQFAPQMDLESCLRDREKRWEAMRKGRFFAGMVPKRGKESMAEGNGFGFRIAGGGLELE